MQKVAGDPSAGSNRSAFIYDKKIFYALAHGYMDASKLRSRIDPVINRKNQSSETDYYENIHEVLKWMDEQSKNQNK